MLKEKYLQTEKRDEQHSERFCALAKSRGNETMKRTHWSVNQVMRVGTQELEGRLEEEIHASQSSNKRKRMKMTQMILKVSGVLEKETNHQNGKKMKRNESLFFEAEVTCQDQLNDRTEHDHSRIIWLMKRNEKETGGKLEQKEE